MNGPLLWRLAARNVRRNLRRSLLTVAAIAFGLFCLILFQSLKAGLHHEMVASTVQLDTGSFQIHAAGYRPNRVALSPLPALPELLGKLDRLGLVYAPRLKAPALVIGPGGSASVLLSGVDPEREARLTIIASRLQSGTYLGGRDELLIGAELATALGVGVGDELKLMARSLLGSPAAKRFKVGGIFRTDLAGFNRGQLFLTLSATRALLRADGLVSEIVVRVPSGEEQQQAARLAAVLDSDRYRVDSWDRIAPDVSQLIELNDGTMRLLVLIVFFIVALGITNTMTMTVFERYREFGILAALGMRPAGIVRLVVAESLLLGLCGALVGGLAGWAGASWFAAHGLDLTALTSSNRYFATSHVLHALLRPGDFWLANLVTLLTGLLAGLYPAWKASRLHPVEALRQN
ncbi:hypothetical protein C2E25_01990 [Geothermobacter hydrogeniphilus]|uniref:ABC transporter permease n=1 Tax=Geothermobacter hydrogeniphilus TaxID=1969733 RepID=A0A2K2HDI1_9BACT|nr:FtsX-like permease family protein [Geothermobacter hydrogeniphilus]PNU21348.1 hypothetical protein C2E25_01990 [Geothermobacter hydrogeniphilus]